MVNRGSTHGRQLGAGNARTSRITLDNLSTDVSIVISSGSSGLEAIPFSRQVWNLVQSVRLKPGWSGSLRDDRHLERINKRKSSQLSP